MTFPRRVIAGIVLLSAACALVAAATSVDAVDIVVGLPLALFLPGAALVWAVDPWRRQLTRLERMMWSFASTIGIVIVGGLALNLTGGLTRLHWLILAFAATGLCGIVGWLRSGKTSEGVSSGDGEPTVTGTAAGRIGRSAYVRHVTLLLAAIAVVAGALVVSQRTNTEAGREHFVQAWILPQPTGNNLSTRTQLGVRNEEGRSQVLVIVIRVGSAKATTSTVGLANGQQWTHEVLRATGQPVSATVALASDPTSVLDRVDLAKPS